MISYLTTLRSASQNAEALRGTPGLSSLEKSLEIMRKVSINSRIVMLLTMTTMLLTMEIMIILSSTWLLSLRAAISVCFLHDLCRYLYSFIHSFIPGISIAPLQVLYYSEALPTTAWILYRSFTPKRTGNCR